MATTTGTLGIDQSGLGISSSIGRRDRVFRPDLCATGPSGSALMPKLWYVIHTLTGQEEKVRISLQRTIGKGEGTDAIAQVIVPMEKVSEVKAGKKTISERRVFPGYVLVEMELTDDSWYAVKSIPGVAGFVGSGLKPVPLRAEEVEQILQASQEKMDKPIPKVVFESGESVRINEGPFNNFNGIVEEISPEKGKLKVMVTIFGRSTPVELEYWQVEKM